MLVYFDLLKSEDSDDDDDDYDDDDDGDYWDDR